MSFITRVTKTVTEGNTSISNSTSHVVETSFKMEETIADAVTNDQYLLAIDISELQAFAIQATVAMTVYTNDAGTGTPDDTFTLVANKPLIWEVGDTPALLTADVTSIYVTNASGGAGQLNIIVGVDTTP